MEVLLLEAGMAVVLVVLIHKLLKMVVVAVVRQIFVPIPP